MHTLVLELHLEAFWYPTQHSNALLTEVGEVWLGGEFSVHQGFYAHTPFAGRGVLGLHHLERVLKRHTRGGQPYRNAGTQVCWDGIVRSLGVYIRTRAVGMCGHTAFLSSGPYLISPLDDYPTMPDGREVHDQVHGTVVPGEPNAVWSGTPVWGIAAQRRAA